MEKENAEKQADVERLQNEIGSDSTSDPGTAFVRPGKSVEEEEDEIIPDEATGDFQAPDDSFESSSTMDLDDDTLLEEETDAVETIPSPTKEDLTLTHIAVESLRVLIKNAKDDVRRIINLTLPVLQPIFDAGDAAWRQMKDLFVKARKAYEAYQTTSSMTADEATETAETCDDAAYA